MCCRANSWRGQISATPSSFWGIGLRHNAVARVVVPRWPLHLSDYACLHEPAPLPFSRKRRPWRTRVRARSVMSLEPAAAHNLEALDEGFGTAFPASAPTVISLPPLGLGGVSAAVSILRVTAVNVRDCCFVADMARSFDHLCTFSIEPDDSLIPMRLGCSANSITNFAGMS